MSAIQMTIFRASLDHSMVVLGSSDVAADACLATRYEAHHWQCPP